MKVINHFSHLHPLKLYETKRWSRYSCSFCNDFLTIPFYGCKECTYCIHRYCAELPQDLSHPFHPQHSLSLCNLKVMATASITSRCNACDTSCSDYYAYHCVQCDFSLDIRCSQLKPIAGQNQTLLFQNNHPHPFLRCEKNSSGSIPFPHNCFVCGWLFDDEPNWINVCMDCKYLMHESCTVPLEINHPFHSEHPLSLFPLYFQQGYPHQCSVCSRVCSHTIVYKCSLCKFLIDIDCVSLLPSSTTSIRSVKEFDYQSPQISHCHPLIQCVTSKKIHPRCSGCDLPIKGSIFFCFKCGFLLDKSCTELLPRISHPFHPMHPLQLDENCPMQRRIIECNGCHNDRYRFSYVCSICDYYLDPHCASIKPPMLKSKNHDHPLAYLVTKLRNPLKCNECEEPCERHFFHCIICEFNLHLKCFPLLPRVIKHNCHCDPLTLSYTKIQEIPDADSDEELYCYACEETREPDDPTYYCKDCPFVAHPHCVLSEILHCLDIEPSVEDVGEAELGTSIKIVATDEVKAQGSSSIVSPTEEAKKKVAAPNEEVTKKIVAAEDEGMIKSKVAEIDREIVAFQNALQATQVKFQSRIQELQSRRNQLLTTLSSAKN